MKNIVLAVLLVLSFFAQAKPFKRALVISGGGLAPGTSLGTIAGAQAAGFDPDIIFFTCGSAMAASLYSGFGSIEAALNYAKSPTYHQFIRKNLRIETRFAPTLKTKIDAASAHMGFLPDLFEGNILSVPEALPERLPYESFRYVSGQPRFVVLAARANFGPEDTGVEMTREPRFKQVFFTDPDTARYLRGRRSDIKRMFPGSYISSRTEVMTRVSLTQAYRASISDPYYMNPARIGNHYYFTGAVDLFPYRTAGDLADQVMMTSPNTSYGSYDRAAIWTAFGIDQQRVAITADHQKNIIWIYTGEAKKFDPRLLGPFLVSSLPASSARYAEMVEAQYKAAYREAYKAAKKAMR